MGLPTRNPEPDKAGLPEQHAFVYVCRRSETEKDELVESAKKDSPRNGDPHAPGKKRVKPQE